MDTHGHTMHTFKHTQYTDASLTPHRLAKESEPQNKKHLIPWQQMYYIYILINTPDKYYS